MSMSDNNSEISFKEIALVLPLTASSIALSFVGRFYPFGGFRFFSISEHILAAIGYLPLALFFTASCLIAFPVYAWIAKWDFEFPSNLISAVVVTALCGVGAILAHLLFRAPWHAAIFGVIFLPLLWIAIFIKRPLASAAGLAVLIAYGIAASLALAADLSYGQIEKAKTDPTFLTNISLKSEVKSAILVMVGDRGVLFYDPMTNTNGPNY
jgi:hypothetical protein